MGCTATFSAHNNMNDCPDLAVFNGLLGHLSSVEDDGLGEELRVLSAHSMRGHHTANARRHDPPGPCPVTKGQVVVCWSDESLGSMTFVSSRAP
jgi:hypothetical protein